MRRLFRDGAVARLPARALAALLLALLVLPILSLVFASSPSDLLAGIRHEIFLPALLVTVRTTLVSLAIVVLSGTPLAWWLATAPSGRARVVELLVELPIVMPPAVIGVALLATFGRSGLLGGGLDALGVHVPFTTVAVVMAQVSVSAPFFVQAAATAFRKVDMDLMLVARTLGSTRSGSFFRVAVPIALPGLLVGATLSWARAMGEFGATLLFAGSLRGKTQTMPLAIYGALESDVRAAIALALVLAAISAVLLLALRTLPFTLLGRSERAGT